MTEAWPVAFPGRLHRFQAEALARIEAGWAAGRQRTLVVLPPGAGKTVVGLEAARRRGRPAVVLSPNTAIQGQWVEQWRAYDGAEAVPIGTDRALASPLTSLTYQSVAAFDPDAEYDESGTALAAAEAHLDRLNPGARALVDRLVELGDVTLVLDECHHLLEVWGALLDEILALLPAATVLGLTATPPSVVDRAQDALLDRLFGDPVYAVSIPAAVRDGRLAPYAELAFLCTPTSVERDWLAEEALRFTELRTDLLDPSFASTAFLTWLDARVGRIGAGDWNRLAKDSPVLADALLRFHHAELCSLPTGARLREPHRHEPQADDWAVLISGYVEEALRPSADPHDAEALDRLRHALPSIGFHLTGAGIRRGRSPADRVLARSAAKATAAGVILAAEARGIGDRMRALVLCDHERATATLPARLVGILDEQAGSALAALHSLTADLDDRPDLGIALVTGRTVAANPAAARRLAAGAEADGITVEVGPLIGGVHTLTGSWTARAWVSTATRLLESGDIGVLVGTRGLLGEGWDARTVTTLVDLTTATTPTAVVQTRGRTLRRDPGWPDKVAHTWSVVCVDHEHPRGWLDWDRFVRKHEAYLGIDEDGEVVAGVSHVSATMSPFAPPPAADVDAVNAGMLVRAEDRDRTRALWQVGTPYEDRLVPMLRIRTSRDGAVEPAAAAPVLPDLLPTRGGLVARPGSGVPRPERLAPRAVAGVGVLAGGILLGLLALQPVAWAWLALVVPAAWLGVLRHAAGRRASVAYAAATGDPGIAFLDRHR